MELSALALAFEETTATSASVHVEGRNFYPPMLHDIASATSSIHINQFGFRPGEIGEAFASTLLAKAAEGVRVRMVVDRQGSDPDRSSRAFYDRLLDGGIEVCVVRAAQPRAVRGPSRRRRREALEPGPARAHRPPQGRRRRRPDRLGRRGGRRGPLPGRPVPRHVPAAHGPRRLAAPARLPRHPPLARQRYGPVRARRALPRAPWNGGGRARGRPAQRPREVPADHGCHRDTRWTAQPDARRREPVRHRPLDDPTDDGRGAARCAGAALRPREREQLGVRGGAAVPPPSAPRVGGRDPRVPGDAAREGLRPRRARTSSSGRATSRRGASGASSRSTSSSGRPSSRSSSRSASRRLRSRCRLPGGLSAERGSVSERASSPRSRRCSSTQMALVRGMAATPFGGYRAMRVARSRRIRLR